MSIFPTTKDNHLTKKAFFDEPVNIARYDQQKYAWLEKLTERQLGFFWQPTEVELLRDREDFRKLSSHEQHIFTSNLKRQILLDSVQGRAPTIAFGPICSLPELETWITTWTFSETIHSRSYTHIIRNIYSNPSKVFDEILDIQEIVDCSKDISKYYDELIAYNNLQSVSLRQPGSEYQHKKSLWLALMSVNVLEGIRFYVSFACSWAFAEMKKMEGNAKIIKLICRDENLHLAGTQQLLKVLPQDDEDYVKIKLETEQECINLFNSAIQQEKDWAKYLFEGGSMIGLNEKLLCDYIDYIASRRMVSIGLPHQRISQNPLPWTTKWISGSEVQVAPQETQITSYVLGGVKKDVTNESFKGFSL